MKTLLIGAGAIGGTLAVLMTDAGYTVDILEISPQIKEDIEAKGLTLTGAHGDHKVNVKAYGSPDEIEEKYDIVIIAVKYMALIPAAKSALKLLKDDSIVIESSGDRSKLQVTRTAVAQNLTVHDEA